MAAQALSTSTSTSTPAPTASRAPWTAPRVDDLPRLTELTLQTINGDCGLGGSTCF